MLTILGPTACGKTHTAVQLAGKLRGEIISADSRQVFRGMNLGTGKDLHEYSHNGNTIAHHLIDIAEAGEEYSVFRFQQDFHRAYAEIIARSHFPILCGGTGLYLDSVIRGFRMEQVPENHELRAQLSRKSMDELTRLLSSFRKPHSTTDTCERDRITRAIEIESYHREHPDTTKNWPVIQTLVIGIRIDRQEIRNRITRRLSERLESGMIGEIQHLLNSGVPSGRLLAYGLEYKYITQHLLGELSYDEMFRLLNTAIHQFAKRQMTWFRHMEKMGCRIHWIDGLQEEDQKATEIIRLLRSEKYIGADQDIIS